MGLEGEQPQSVDPESIEGRVKKIQTGGEINLLKEHTVKFDYQKVKTNQLFVFFMDPLHLIFSLSLFLPAPSLSHDRDPAPASKRHAVLCF
jgi:hypothetical protein